MSPRRVNLTRLGLADGLAARSTGGGGGGLPDAPKDGQLYGRQDAAWAPVPDPSGDIQALQGRMDTAEGEIDALQTSDTAQGERLDALETSDTAQDGKITALEASDTALGERLTAAEGKITTAEGEIDALQAADTAQAGRLDALEASDTEQDGKITALEAADTALGERLTAAEGKITTAEVEIDALEAADTAQARRLDTAEGEIDALDGRVTELEEQSGGGGLSDAPQDGQLYGRKDGAWADALEAPPAETHSYANSRIGYTCIHAANAQAPEWVPSVLSGVSAYDVTISGGAEFFKPFYEVIAACSLTRFPLIMGGTQSETMRFQTLYSVNRSGRSVTITGFDFNLYPDVYEFTLRCSDESGEFVISECNVERV